MRVLTVLAVLFTLSAFATEWETKKFSFSPRTYEGGVTRYYNCDSLETDAENLLEQLGASNARVRCFGGIEHGSRFPMPAHLTGSFDWMDTGDVAGFTMKGRENCAFATEFLEYIVPMIPGAKIVSRRASCSSRNPSWKYVIHIGE